MYNFWIQTKTYYQGLYDWLHPRGYIANVVVFPVLMLLMYSTLGRFALDEDAAIFFGIGILVYNMMYNVISAITMSYANDRLFATIPFLYVSNANRFLNFLSRCVGHFPTGLLAFLVGLLVVRLGTGITFNLIHWGGLTITVLVINLSICFFAQALGIFSIVYKEWLNTLAFSIGIVFVFTGMIIPLRVWPPFIRELAAFLPTTNGTAALRLAFLGDLNAEFYQHLIRELILGFAYFAIGFIGFVIFERVAIKKGILDQNIR